MNQQSNSPDDRSRKDSGSPSLLPTLSEETWAAFGRTTLTDEIRAEIAEKMRAEKSANPALVDAVTQAMQGQLHFLQEDDPTLSQDDVERKLVIASVNVAIYLLARQAEIDVLDLETQIIGLQEES